MVDMRRLLAATAIGFNSWAFTSGGSLGTRRRVARIPAVILVFILIDVSLGLSYLLNEIVGRPIAKLTLLLDLDEEQNFSTWYSSTQWFCVSIFLGLFAHSNFRISQKRSWLLPVLALLFLALSVDEIARIHEWLGQKTDILLPGGSRANTSLPDTGIWMFVIGIPFLAAFVWLISSIRMYFQDTPSAFIKIFAGMLIMLIGALGFDGLTNFVAPGSMYAVLQVFLEEFLEMLGGTIVLWGTYDLLRAHGFAISLSAVALDHPAQKPSTATPKNRRKRAISNRRPRAA